MNIATLSQIKRKYIVFFNTLDNESYYKLPHRKKNSNNTQEEQDKKSLSNEKITTWCDDFQETFEGKGNMKAKKLEVHLNYTFNTTLKEFQDFERLSP